MTEKGFEIGKYYKHSGGGMMHIISAAHTTVYGWTHIAEGADGSLTPVGMSPDHAVNWTEAREDEWDASFS